MQTNISTYIQANIIIIYLFFLGVFLITATFAFLVENDQCGDHLQRNSGMWPYINDKTHCILTIMNHQRISNF